MPGYMKLFSKNNIIASAMFGGDDFIYEASKLAGYYDNEEDTRVVEDRFDNIKDKETRTYIQSVFLGRLKLVEKINIMQTNLILAGQGKMNFMIKTLYQYLTN